MSSGRRAATICRRIWLPVLIRSNTVAVPPRRVMVMSELSGSPWRKAACGARRRSLAPLPAGGRGGRRRRRRRAWRPFLACGGGGTTSLLLCSVVQQKHHPPAAAGGGGLLLILI